MQASQQCSVLQALPAANLQQQFPAQLPQLVASIDRQHRRRSHVGRAALQTPARGVSAAVLRTDICATRCQQQYTTSEDARGIPATWIGVLMAARRAWPRRSDRSARSMAPGSCRRRPSIVSTYPRVIACSR